MDVIQRLKAGDSFSGRNGAFTGTVQVSSFHGIDIVVDLEKDGCKWKEEWDLKCTIWAFERGDYYFLEN